MRIALGVGGSPATSLRPPGAKVEGWRLGAAIAVVYAIAHLPTLAPSLEDIDSINFALGLRDFDPAQHQPHPPGYPVYIAAGRVALAAVRPFSAAAEQAVVEARALSLLSAIACGFALAFAFRVFDLLAAESIAEQRARVRVWATLVLAACPLFWITAARPMSDMPGLAAALGVQALLLAGRPRAGAFAAGLALGVRSQVLWLTAPLIARDVYRAVTARAWRTAAAIVACAAAGAIAWAIPLVVATGGIEAYLGALGSQGGEDFAFVDMLWTNPTPRRLAFGLLHTLVMPWGSPVLASIVLAVAVTGAIVLLARERRSLGLVLLAFAPYAAFHLVFQETITVRYALPVTIPIAYLAARAFSTAGRATNVLATPLVVLLTMSAIAGVLAYAEGPHPAFRAIRDAERRAAADRPAMVTSHFELRRSLRAVRDTSLPIVYAPHQREWLELVGYWAGGGRATVWFLANPRRADLDLIDQYSRRDVVRYRWRAAARPELSGTRPDAVDWYRLRPPGWFVGEGWSLTPEAGGLTQAAGTGPDRRPIAGYVRRQSVPMHGVIGGRLLVPSSGAVSLELALDGAVLDRWTVTAGDPAFLRIVTLPAGIPGRAGDYAMLTVRASGPAAVRHFDVQPETRPVFGFGPGWHDEELEPSTGLRWRWTEDRAVLRVRSGGRAVRVRTRGESPLNYFDASPAVTLSAGGRVLDRFEPAGDWQRDVIVPADALPADGGDVTIATSQVFIPAKVTGSPDTRRLGLRIFAIDVESAR